MAEDLDRLVKFRKSLKGNVTRTINYLEKNDCNIDDLEIRKTKLEEQYQQFQSNQIEIELLIADAKELEKEETHRDEFEASYFKCAKLIHEKLRALNLLPSSQTMRPNSQQSNGSSSNLNFPAPQIVTVPQQTSSLKRLELKPFNGNPQDWPGFQAAFLSLVHNNDQIPVIEKFYHLKNALSGDIVELLEGLSPSIDHYQVAWESVQERCNRPRAIIQIHLKHLFELPEMNKLSVVKIRSLKEKAEMRVNALKALGEPVESWNSFLIYIVTRKLDKFTRKAWEETLEDDAKPQFSDLMSFLKKKGRGDIDDSESNNTHNNSNHNNRPRSMPRGSQALVGTSKQKGSQNVCVLCKSDHRIYECEDFLKLSPHDRSKLAREKKLCMNCLRDNHLVSECRSSRCKHCPGKHNSLLHFGSTQANCEKDTGSSSAEKAKVGLTVVDSSETLLGTARVKIFDKFGKDHNCRILLDSCSQDNFITEKLARNLKLDCVQIDLPFTGLGQLKTRAKFRVKATIKSRINDYQSDLDFVALPVITTALPSCSINSRTIQIPKNVRLADPEFYKTAEIDALVGVKTFYELLSVGQIKIVDENIGIVLQKTVLGWIVTGDFGLQSKNGPRVCHLVTSLETQLNRFWELEEVPHEKHLSSDDQKCETLFSETTTRDENGRFTVRLPFNEKIQNIGDSYGIALRRYHSLERRLSKDDALKQKYHDFLREYLTLNHMREINDTDSTASGYFIPHQAVVKESSSTTKVRVVFDGSVETSTGISLNNALLVGPKTQDDLVNIIIRFRTHNVVIVADLEKMYRQVKVDERDAIFQKILWRKDPDDIIRIFLLTTITQGTSPAMFLATRALQQTAIEEGTQFPDASRAIFEDFYVDDVLTGAESIEKASQLKEQLIEIVGKGGFKFHKWNSNKSELLDSMNDANGSKICLNSGEQKLLGIHWDSNTDTIKYSVESNLNDSRITKRSVLSGVARLFDPLGLLGPVVIIGKIIMQQLCLAKLDWDESIPMELQTKWKMFREELKVVNDFRIPRQIVLPNAVDIQLHGFGDASESAYGACVYVRSVDVSNQCSVHLVCAKSRVAPTKLETPKLELCASLLLSRLVESVKKSLRLNISKIYLWSDSTIVLHWIRTSPHLLKTFVGNRVALIQRITSEYNWYHIDGKENPADIISRGQRPLELINNNLWWRGPVWLDHDEDRWNVLKLSTVEIPEMKTKVVLLNTSDGHVFNRFSSFKSLNRFVALCHRAIANLRNPQVKQSGQYSIEELRNAQFQIIKIIQIRHFSSEIEQLGKNIKLDKTSKCLSLDPFLDSHGILRVGGRLTKSSLSYSKKFPILLPRNEHVTKLIIREEHEKCWHAGVQSALNSVRQNYWPVDGKNVTRAVVNKCIRCCKLNPKIPNYIMGELPKNRVVETRPFLNVGIDYCGAFFIKEKKLRNTKKVKVYVVVIVCFATKAVHLELVTDLTTETCIEAIERFSARRGKPLNIYSDNATNFVGSKKELMQVKAFLLSQENDGKFRKFFQNQGIEWHMIPPRSPHFGGLWEAAVKSFKHHLYRVVGDSLFTYEQFNTCIIQIEAILTSRPLTPISSDPNDFVALTPSHFLIGDHMNSLPEYDLRDLKTNRLSCWQHIKQVKQHFWQRWHKEYLNELRTRSKWHKGDCNEIKVGQLVTIKEDNAPPMHWSLGRIIAVYRGSDNVIRVAKVKTSNGEYDRCVKKLAPLPIDVK